jgi:type VI secretion system ImpB/VipA family protein
MPESFQNEIPSARINMKLDVGKGSAKKKIELPLKMLVMGDFTQKKRTARVSDREKINLNKNNFEQVMKSQGLKLNYTVENKLFGRRELKVDLDVNSMDSFHPENITKEIPELSRLLAARNLLKELKSNLLDNRAFRSRLEEIMKDPDKVTKLQKELQNIVHLQDGLLAGDEAKTAEELQYLFETLDVAVPDHAVDISGFENTENLAESKANERISASLAFFVENVFSTTQAIEKVDTEAIDKQIDVVDRKISLQLDEIIHNPSFQKMESAWCSLRFLIDRTDFRKNVKIDLLNVSKDELAEDFEDSPETVQSGLYKHIYVDEYDAI